jgi:hypothetical protein
MHPTCEGKFIMLLRDSGGYAAKPVKYATPAYDSQAKSVAQAAAYKPSGTSPSAAEEAKRIVDTGRGFLKNDEDARLAALANELATGSNDDRKDLMAQVIQQDPNLFSSWLTPQRVNDMQRSGEISSQQKSVLAETVAQAYNDGEIPEGSINTGQLMGKVGEGTRQRSELDSVVDSYLAPSSDPIESAQRTRDFLDFMQSSDGPEVLEFRTKYSQHLIDQYVFNAPTTNASPEQRNAAAGLAGNLLGGDINHPGIAVNTLKKYSEDQIKELMQSASISTSLNSKGALERTASDRMLDVDDMSVPDGAQQLMLSVAMDGSKDADKIAVGMARLPTTAPKIFDDSYNYNADNRVDALTLVASRHSKAILDKFTTYNDDTTGPNLKAYMQDASELGALFKTSLFNPDSTYSALLQEKVTAYAGGLKNDINQTDASGKPTANAESVQRLAMLTGSLTDAVQQGYDGIAKDEAASKEFLGTLVDIAFAGIPAGKLLSGGAENLIASTFKSTAVKESLNGLSGKIIDTATGQLTDSAKDAMVEALGKDKANVLSSQDAANQLKNSFFNQDLANDDPDKADLASAYSDIGDGIAIWRSAQ